jgi:hypothetical protein
MAPDRRRGAWCGSCRWEAQDVGRSDRVAMLLPWRHANLSGRPSFCAVTGGGSGFGHPLVTRLESVTCDKLQRMVVARVAWTTTTRSRERSEHDHKRSQRRSGSKPAITRALDRLSEFDLVRRKTDPLDRRSVLVQRTATGMAFLRELRTILRDAATAMRITIDVAPATRPRAGGEARATH